MPPPGYHGRYLRVDLSKQCIESIKIPDAILRQYLGGSGLGTWILHREAPVGIKPLSPEAPLIFALSPLVGTPLTTSAKFAVVAKSPLTNRLNDALSSSWFALAAKKAGCDALVLVGACESPSLLILDDGAMRIESARDLWGRPIPECESMLKDRLGADFHNGVIGPAGENLVRYATISFDTRHAGRGGLGAVMGSKRLKALAIRGAQRVALADPERVVELSRELSQKSFGPATAKYRELGTVANLLTFNRFETLPTRNFQQGSFEDANALSEEEMGAAHRVARRSCAACTIGCEHIYRATGGREVRLEYESLFALGPLCGIGDREVVLQAARLCDDLGLDTISTGATIAFAMECAERDLIDEPELRFGRGQKLLEILPQIANRKGLGDLLADGSRRMAEFVGGAAPEFAPHVKGLEIPGYEPRALQTMALGFAVSSRGADHNRSGAYEADFSEKVDRLHGDESSVPFAIETEDKAALMDSLILCKFLRGVFVDFFDESAELLRAITGWNCDGEELRTISRRIVTAKKIFNIREGWTHDEDTLPRRFLSTGLKGERVAKLSEDQLQSMIRAYYHERGWNRDGTISNELIQSLNL